MATTSFLADSYITITSGFRLQNQWYYRPYEAYYNYYYHYNQWHYKSYDPYYKYYCHYSYYCFGLTFTIAWLLLTKRLASPFFRQGTK